MPSCGTFLSDFSPHLSLNFPQVPRACYVLYVACLVYFDFITKVETCSLIMETQDIRFSSKSNCVGPCDLIGNKKIVQLSEVRATD